MRVHLLSMQCGGLTKMYKGEHEPQVALCLTPPQRAATKPGNTGGTTWMDTFIEENHDLLKGFHEVDVVVTVLLNLLQQDQLGLALGAEHSQQRGVLLRRSGSEAVSSRGSCRVDP